MSIDDKKTKISRLMDPVLRQNLLVRHRVKQQARIFFCKHGFVEVDTPILGERLDEYTTHHFQVEGQNGHYCLPQSPQLYKQLIVMRCFDRYFQFPHCFRDEEFDPRRSDQVPEFMQIDFELQAKSKEDVMLIAEELIEAICDELALPCQRPFPVLDAVDCITRYHSDKPDFRNSQDQNAFVWVVDFPLAECTMEGKLVASHHPFALPILQGNSLPIDNIQDLRSHSFDLVLNGMEIGGGDLRINSYELQEEILQVFGLKRSQFDSLLLALREGPAPAHGGMAIGFDRLLMQLTRTQDIRNVNAF